MERNGLGRSGLLIGLGLSLTAVGAAVFFVLRQWTLTGSFTGMPLDDAYIHLRFAQNLATGQGFAFNPGEAVPGSTSPLWVVALALAAVVGVPLWLAAKVYGIACLAVAAVLAWRLALQVGLRGVAALSVGLLTALDGRLLWAAPSGMEVTLFTALSLAAFLARPEPTIAPARRTRRLILLAVLCALATLARPEGYLLTVLLGIDVAWRLRLPQRLLAALALLYAVLVMPYILFALLTTGHPLPTTFYAKAGGGGIGVLGYLAGVLSYLLLTNPGELLALVGVPVLLRYRGASTMVVVWPLALLLGEALFSPLLYHFGRYIMPLQPFIALWAVAGVSALTRRSRDRWREALPPLALVALALLTLGTWATLYARSVDDIDRMQVAAARWVQHHAPPGAPIATHDVGAIGYLSGHPVVDIVGLVTPSFIGLEHEPPPRRTHDVVNALRQKKVQYLIIMPEAFPWLRDALHPRQISSVTVARPVIEPATTMVIYDLGQTTAHG